jgi:ribose transport system substrate-binding protein
MNRLLKLAALSSLLAFAGCGGNQKASDSGLQGKAASGGTSGKRLHIAVVPKMLNNPVFPYAGIGARRAAKELGNVDIEYTAPQKDDATQQATTVDSMVAKGVSGILISCSNPDTLRTPIDKAVKAGIPVVTFDADSPKSKRVAYYGVNDINLGNRLGQEIGRLLNGKGKVAILSGTQGAANLTKRDQGVREALKKFPGIQIIDTFYCNDDLPKSAQIVTDVTRSQKPDGWVFVGGWPLFTSNGLNAIQPGQTKVVSADPLPNTWHWIQDNHVQVCLGQKVFGWGEEGTKLLVRAIKGEKIPEFNDSGFDVVTPATLADYKKKWAEMSKEP